MLLVAIAVLVGVGSFREKYNVVIMTEEQYHELYLNASLEADVEYYAELERNLEKVND